jgi:metal-dependent HD superfamily phosphatase/phosphodiesterase
MTMEHQKLEQQKRRNSPAKREELDHTLIASVGGWVRPILEDLLHDPELDALQNTANHVSVVRLGYNDHGPIHMRIATVNALTFLALLHDAGVPPSLVREEKGTYLDAQFAVALGGLIHDVGMAVTRDRHEWHSLHLGRDLIIRYIARAYPNSLFKQMLIRALIHEIVIGHMGYDKVFSIEAGTLLVGDGTDMTRGRAKRARELSLHPVLGDMHRHSAFAITSVEIRKGDALPAHISITMSDYAGIFQVEEVLIPKISVSPLRSHIEVAVVVGNDAPRRYLG